MRFPAVPFVRDIALDGREVPTNVCWELEGAADAPGICKDGCQEAGCDEGASWFTESVRGRLAGDGLPSPFL